MSWNSSYILKPVVRSPEDLIEDIDNGILIQSVTGLHSGVNPISEIFQLELKV